MDSILNTMQALNREYLQRYPDEAMHVVSELDEAELVTLLREQPVQMAVRIWDTLSPEIAAEILSGIEDDLATELFEK
jgi:Mg/Co/Ni transporter MgtE